MQDLRRSQSSNATLGANEGHRGDDQPAVVYDGSPMHDYLASVAPEELPSSSIMPAGQSFAAPRRTSSASEASEAPNSSDDRAGQLGTPPRRKSRSTSRSSSNSSSSHHHARRKRFTPSKQSPSTISSANRDTVPNSRANEDDPLLSEARERLNLLLVSYLSAPHYSALPPQDQECIDRETVNAFLLDERFQRYSRRGTIIGRHTTSVDLSGRGGGPNDATSKEGQSKEHQPKLVMTRGAQLFFFGICSIALLTPTFASTTSNSAIPVHPSLLSDFFNSILPEAVTSWPSWTNGLIRTAPGVVAVTGLAAFFARSGAASGSIVTSANIGINARPLENQQEEQDAVIRELRILFNACKKFIDECTRLDITLEKGFTVIAELDQLVEEEEGKYAQDHVIEAEGGDLNDPSFASRLNDVDDSNWQDLTAIEARLAASHPHPFLLSEHQNKTRKKRLPALDVRRAIFSCLYNIQDRLEKDLDELATPSESRNPDAEEEIDSLELQRLLDMYSCHLSAEGDRQHAREGDILAQAEERAAEELYRRTMARRSLSPTLYNEQQQQAKSSPAAKLKRRSGVYGSFASVKQVELPDVPSIPIRSSQEGEVSRRASWTAFQPSQRRHVESTILHGKAAPSSPSSTLAHRSRNPAVATPPRVRPQSIHFGSIHPSSAQMMNVTSSPLASGARESNSTIKRERKRRSEQNFSLSGMQTNLQFPDDEPISQLRSSTSSNASEASSMGSSAAMRMSTSSQGTSADPITAVSCLPGLYGSPSRPAHMRRTSLDQFGTTSRTSLQQQNRRSRPLSMHELDYGKLTHRSSFSHLDANNSQLDEVPETDSTASHRSAAAAALERRWYAHPEKSRTTSSSVPSSVASPMLKHKSRSRPTSLLLQSSPILSSAHASFNAEGSESPAASSRSRRSRHRDPKGLQTRSKFALESLRDSSKRVSTLERAFLCHILALKYSPASPRKLRKTLQVLLELVDGINKTIDTETSSVSQAMWEEFEGQPPKDIATSVDCRAPPASVLLATPITSSAFQSTPKRSSFVACLPGSYPSSPMIEVDPATPPSNIQNQSPRRSFFPPLEPDDRHPFDFAPRNPFSSDEQSGREGLAESHVHLNAALRNIASKLYMERQDLKAYFQEPPAAAEGSRQHLVLDQMDKRHESLKADIQALMRSWEEGRATIRQMKQGQRHRIEASTIAQDGKVRAPPDDASHCDITEDEPSLLSTSSELEQYGSVSSILSSSNEDSLSTPSLSPMSQAAFQPPNIDGLLLDDGSQHLPRYGLQEQLFEAYVDDEEVTSRRERVEGKLSRNERIALAKSKRQEKKEGSTVISEPQVNAEFISELKDMVALLRSRNSNVTSETRSDST